MCSGSPTYVCSGSRRNVLQLRCAPVLQLGCAPVLGEPYWWDALLSTRWLNSDWKASEGEKQAYICWCFNKDIHCMFVEGSQEQSFFLQTLLFTPFVATVQKIITYALVSTWSWVSSGWEHVTRFMHHCRSETNPNVIWKQIQNQIWKTNTVLSFENLPKNSHWFPEPTNPLPYPIYVSKSLQWRQTLWALRFE